MVGDAIEVLATRARAAKKGHENLRRALMLNGRARRTGADYYMIHEYAEMEFGGTKGIRSALGLTVDEQERLARSAQVLPPLLGGRHAKYEGDAPMSLDGQAAFVADLLRRWIVYAAGNS